MLCSGKKEWGLIQQCHTVHANHPRQGRRLLLIKMKGRKSGNGLDAVQKNCCTRRVVMPFNSMARHATMPEQTVLMIQERQSQHL
jgi:hypothetical protein